MKYPFPYSSLIFLIFHFKCKLYFEMAIELGELPIIKEGEEEPIVKEKMKELVIEREEKPITKEEEKEITMKDKKEKPR